MDWGSVFCPLPWVLIENDPTIGQSVLRCPIDGRYCRLLFAGEGPKLVGETLLVRGEEHPKFLNSLEWRPGPNGLCPRVGTRAQPSLKKLGPVLQTIEPIQHHFRLWGLKQKPRNWLTKHAPKWLPRSHDMIGLIDLGARQLATCHWSSASRVAAERSLPAWSGPKKDYKAGQKQKTRQGEGAVG